MRIINKKYVLENKDFIIKEMKSGKIFIYPTDTIYGIGCNAMDSKSSVKIREIKKRTDKPFSIISPNMNWIRKNCIIGEGAESWLMKLPGSYTFILKLKNKKEIAKEVSNGDSLGVRMPDNWFSEIVSLAGIPFVTTSVNISGEKFMTSLSDLDNKIKNRVDYIVDDGLIDGKPSTVISLVDGKGDMLRQSNTILFI